MLTSGPYLPKKDSDLADMMLGHGDREAFRLSSRMIRWQLASLYLAGERRFEIRTPWGVYLKMEEMEFDRNDVPMHVSHLLSIHNRVIGMLNGMDLRPLVQRDDSTLAATRDRAVAQVVLDAVLAGNHVEHIRRQFLHYFSLLGSAGLHAQVGDFPHLGLTAELEVVHPKEIYPFPSVGGDLSRVTGLVRDRWIPWTRVMKAFDIKKIPEGAEVEYRQVGEGGEDAWADGSWSTFQTGGSAGRMGSGPRSKDRAEEAWLRCRELWCDGPRGTVSEYAATTGKEVLARISYEREVAYRPLAFQRFYESGDFHGAGVFDLVFSCVREFEKLVRDFVANVREQDKFTTVVLPAGTFDEKKLFGDYRNHLRAVSVDTEPKGLLGSQAPVRPMTINPSNSGALPGQTAEFLLKLIRDLAPLRDIIEDKGRVDSFSGLQFLQDEAQRPVANPVSALVSVFGDAYKYVASQAFNQLAESPRPIRVGRLSMDLLGAVIDPETATLTFSQGRNAAPDITRLRFGVKQTNLKMLAARKAEAVELLKLGIKDRTDFLIHAVQEGLDYAMCMDRERACYDSTMSQIIMLYGNGSEPGGDPRWNGIVTAAYLENAEMALRIIDSVMQSPQMRVASVEVINAFKQLRETMVNWTGSVLPQSIPDYTEAAVAAMMAQKGQPIVSSSAGRSGSGRGAPARSPVASGPPNPPVGVR